MALPHDKFSFSNSRWTKNENHSEIQCQRKIEQIEKVTVWLWNKNKKKWTKQIELCEIILGMFVFQLFQILNYLHFPHRGFLNHLPTFCYVVAIDATENTNSSIHAFEYTTTISRKLEAVVEFNFFSSLFFLLSYSFIWFVCFFSVVTVDQVHGHCHLLMCTLSRFSFVNFFFRFVFKPSIQWTFSYFLHTELVFEWVYILKEQNKMFAYIECLCLSIFV